ncbi:MAG TPA: hypothetical protein VHO69_00435, partial [Phototrophicaceae bacterium]|nr:hypothetical protein [Phototrophicaceae bacterium]
KKYQDEVQQKADLVNADTAKVREVEKELERQSVGLNTQLQTARAEIDAVFDGMRQRGMAFIDNNLSISKIGRAPKREVLQAEFQEVVVGRALRDINEATGGYINAVIDNSRLYWRGVINRLNQLRDLMQQELSGLDAGIYAEQRESLEEAIRIAEVELRSYSTGRVVADIQEVFQANMTGFTATAGVTIVGLVLVLLEIVTKSALVAGPLGALVPPVALVVTGVGGVFAWRYYRHISRDAKEDLHTRLDHLEKSYHEALDELTQKERNRLTQYGKQVLTPIFSRLEVLAQRYAAQNAALRAHVEQINTLREGIEKSH